MNEAMCTIVGFVATPVRSIEGRNGTIASFRIGTTRSWYDRNAQKFVNGHTSFLTVTCYRALAKNVESSLQRWEPVVVYGRVKVKDWEKDGRSGTSMEVEAKTVGHDLTCGTAMFARQQRATTQPEPDADELDLLARQVEADQVGVPTDGFPDFERLIPAANGGHDGGHSGAADPAFGDFAGVDFGSGQPAPDTGSDPYGEGPLADAPGGSSDSGPRAA